MKFDSLIDEILIRPLETGAFFLPEKRMEHELHEYTNDMNKTTEHELHELHEYTNGTNEERVIYKDLSYKIMEACFEVHNNLGPGFSEKIYEEAMTRELKEKGIFYERQKLIDIYYKDEKIGEYRLDLFVENKVILELKAVSELNSIFESQIYSYLKATGMKLGILINFGNRKVDFRRIVI